MKLTLQNLLPAYIPPGRTETSGVWGKNLSYDGGERVHVIAPSGSGKTSLIHFLYGLRNDYNGTIHYGDSSIKNFTAEAFAVQRSSVTSVVLQDMRLFPELTVQQNLEVKRQLAPYHPPQKIAEMAKRLGIADKLSALAKTCSYGEQQRVAIIRSLLQPFRFLLLDEPFSHLDTANAKNAMQLMLEEAAARKATILLADLEQVSFFPATAIYHL